VVKKVGPRRVAAVAHESFDGAMVVKTLGLEQREQVAVAQFEHFIRVEGQELIGWRDKRTAP